MSYYNLPPTPYNLCMFPLHDPLHETAREELRAYDRKHEQDAARW